MENCVAQMVIETWNFLKSVHTFSPTFELTGTIVTYPNPLFQLL